MYRQAGDDANQMNQYLPLMLLKDKLGGDDDTMKLALLSSMTGGNIADSCNWLTSYLMLDTFMSKKDNKALQTVVDTPVEKEDKISQPAVDDTAE